MTNKTCGTCANFLSDANHCGMANKAYGELMAFAVERPMLFVSEDTKKMLRPVHSYWPASECVHYLEKVEA